MNVTRWPACLAALLALHVAAAAIAPAAHADGPSDESIDAAHEAFEDGSFNWYDGETDSLRPLRFRESPKWKLWDLSSALSIVVWSTLAVLLAALVGLLIYFARNQAILGAVASATGDDVILDAERVDALPFLARRARGDLLGQARFHYEQGNYAEAIIYLFSYQLVELDKFSMIRLAKGKTNRQYLRETSQKAPLATALERTMLAFEGVFFGRRTLDRAGFEACWNALGEFEQELRRKP